MLLLHPLTGQVGIYELGDADTLHGLVLATPEELEDRRPQARGDAWYANHARLINDRLDMDGYGTAPSDLTPAGRSPT